MKLLKAIFILCFASLLLVAALFVRFSYDTFSMSRLVKPVDTIVVLTGGKGRVLEGVRLFKQGTGTRLFLIGVDPRVSRRDLYKPAGNDPKIHNVILEKQSRNTLENALYGRDLLSDYRVNSILLITSRYHMKRSELLFRTALPSTVRIYPYPVDTTNLKEDWWHHEGSARLLWTEFYKYYLLRIYFLISSNELQPTTTW